MRIVWPCVILSALLIISITVSGCISTKPAVIVNTTTTTPARNVSYTNTTVTTVPVPTRPLLTEADRAFIRDAIQIEAISIQNISETLATIKDGRYDDARMMAESAKKTLKLQYTNLSERSVSPAIEPAREEILAAMRDEINGTDKLNYIAISDSETMVSASKDYTEAADALFKSANVHLVSAQLKINALTK
ncbi:MAG TPA: hypothetical protein VMS89_03565 [Methanoregulaceae archaeon]|nr:hypothetical protein [Methanoregulaceae archaeon]